MNIQKYCRIPLAGGFFPCPKSDNFDNMNAEEARRKALEAANTQIEKIKSIIEVAATKAETWVGIDFELKEGSQERLKKNGYTIGKSMNYPDTMTVSW